jgi:hypothetical protein
MLHPCARSLHADRVYAAGDATAFPIKYGDRPLHLSAHLVGGHGSSSQVSVELTWSPATKIAAKYLAPYLESQERAALR